MEHWPQVKIGDICIVERGGSPRPIDKYITNSENGINWIKIGDTDDSMYITSTAQKIIPEGAKKSRYVQSGDFLLSNSMSFGRPYILKIDGCIHDGWLVLRDNNGLFDKRFLYYYLSAPSIYQKFKSLAVGGVVNNLNSEMVRNVYVPLPALDEQDKIATKLDKLSDLISLRKRQLTKLEELVKARFMEMFGDLADPFCKYHKCTLVEACLDPDDIKCGPFGTQLNKDEYQVSGIAVWEIPQINSGFTSKPTHFLTEEKAKQLKSYSIEPGDIAMSRKGNVGKCGLFPGDYEPGIIHSDVLRIRVDSNRVIPCFMMHQLRFSRAVQNQIEMVSSGAIMAGVNVTKLKQIEVYIPEYELQENFTAFVGKIGQQKLTIQQSLDKLEVLKKSLMQEYFGGA